MSNFFRKIPQLLVVFVLLSALVSGPVYAVEGDSSSDAPDVVPSASDGDLDAESSGNSGGSNLGGSNLSSSGTVVSGADVTVNVQRHDTLSVVSVSPDAPDNSTPSVYFHSDSDVPTLADTIRSLFGSYTPRTQTVTTYYDGQPISTEQQIIPGLAGLDYEWIAGVVLFGLIVFCLFRLLGGVVRYG